MKKTAQDARLEYEAPTAEIVRLETEDIITTSLGELEENEFERDYN